ncbi:hypothetical protein [Streptomyces sp. NPDC096142]|uniref:3'-5' exonuclease n=1 Tax=Streptomyces sp. NPDC096142 TaxID=3366077 RepID=UPI003805E3E3
MRDRLPLAFIDCETTHLSAELGDAWEVGIVLREFEDDQHTDTEYVWQIRPRLATADPKALEVGRYLERFAVPPHAEAAFTAHESGHVTPMTRAEAVTAIVNVLSGAVLIGSNPGFDERFLRKLVGPGGAQWHYRPYDIVQLAAAKIGAQQAGSLPWSSYVLSRAIGVEPPGPGAAHTALGDARWARDVHDAATRRQPYEVTLEGRAQHAIGLYVQTACELDDARRELRKVRALAEAAQAPGADGQPSDADTLWPSAVLALLSPSQPVMTGEVEVYEVDDQEEDDEVEETGDSDGDVLDLISDIAARLSDATDEGEYHAVNLIGDLANGRTTVADARAELAEITFRHV